MPHRGGQNLGATLVPDLSQGVNAITQGIQLHKQQKAEAQLSGLIEDFHAPGISDKNQERILSRIAKIDLEKAKFLEGVIERDDVREVREAKELSDESHKLMLFFEALPKGQKGKAISDEVARIRIQAERSKDPNEKQFLTQKALKIAELGQLSGTPLDMELMRRRIAAGDIKTVTKQMEARRKRQDLAGQELKDSMSKIAFGALQIIDGEKSIFDAVPATNSFLEERKLDLERRGLPTTQIQNMLDTPEHLRQQQFQSLVNEGLPLKDVVKTQPTKETFEPVFNEKGEIIAQRSSSGKVISDPRAIREGNQRGAFTKSDPIVTRLPDGSFAREIPVLNSQTGKIENKIVPVSGQPVSKLGETGQQLTARKIEQAGGETRAERLALIGTQAELTGVQKRTQRDFVNMDSALAAAENIPQLEKNLELLKSIETGGIDAIALATARTLGVESGDQAELTFNLRSNVLKQLKPTFGAQFTEREGKLLAEIQASETKSTAGNIRLMKRAIEIYDRAVDRGLRAARRQGDDDLIADIEEARASLAPLSEASQSQSASPQGSQLTPEQKSRLEQLRQKQR